MAPNRKTFVSLLCTAFRLAFLRRVDEDQVRASWSAVAIAAAIVPLGHTLFALESHGLEGALALHNLSGVFSILALAFFSSVVVAAALRREGLVPALLLAWLLAWLAVDASLLAVQVVATEALGARRSYGLAMVADAAAAGWTTLAFARFAWNLRAASAARRAMALPLAALLFALPLAYLAPDRALWDRDWSREAADGGDRMAAASEEVFYRQPEILAAELAAVRPHRPGVVDVYFVGMAGYGYQDVFMREVEQVAAIMRERFDAEGRVVKLVNNTKTLLSSPIASGSSLRAALRRVASQMDVEEDVLVLFLTSHGSEEHRFSLDLWPLRFKDLDPATLRAILDESGIRNRVLIVSACYSGGFVEPLRNERSLVITAAAPDRNSFGCGNEDHWTYFGKAYFDEALRTTHSFAGAFDAAAPVIAQREKAADYTPSRPMMAAGEAIRAKLAELERQLAAPAGRPRLVSGEAAAR